MADDHRRRAALVQRASNPGRHSVGMMAPPFENYGVHRWDGELEMTTIFCRAGMAQLHNIQDQPGPSRRFFIGAREYASDSQKGARGCDALISFASIGAEIDPLILAAGVTCIAYAWPRTADLVGWA